MEQPKKLNPLTLLGPGILVAATGVGAGDLATGALAGSHLGVAILWAVLLGAGLKFVLNEGLARWQLATGQTLLEGCFSHLARWVQIAFLGYLLFWSFFVARALMGACGVTATAIFLPTADVSEANNSRIVLGIAHSLVGVALVLWGGYRLFEKVMSFCIALMFLTVIVTAALLASDWAAIGKGLAWPTIPDWQGQGVVWTVGLMGGVGGTLTVLCYGYWIREEGRASTADLGNCRIDLGVAYAATAVFGVAMVVIGSTITIRGQGSLLLVNLAERLGEQLGAAGRWAFLVGAWGAVFSSLLGVWQSVPYLFADSWGMYRASGPEELAQQVDTRSLAYRAYLFGIAVVPMLGLWGSFQQMQKVYAVFGAAFMPMLAAVLIVLNGRADLVGEEHRNRPLTVIVLWGTLLFFLGTLGLEVYSRFFEP